MFSNIGQAARWAEGRSDELPDEMVAGPAGS
jgi:hypothetical protein